MSSGSKPGVARGRYKNKLEPRVSKRKSEEMTWKEINEMVDRGYRRFKEKRGMA